MQVLPRCGLGNGGEVLSCSWCPALAAPVSGFAKLEPAEVPCGVAGVLSARGVGRREVAQPWVKKGDFRDLFPLQHVKSCFLGKF